MYQKKIIESLLLKLPHVLAIVVGCLILYLLSWCKRSRKMKGPPSVSVLANIPSLEAYPEKIFAKWAKTYGAVYSIKVGRHYTIVLNGYEAIHQVLWLYSELNVQKTGKSVNCDQHLFATGIRETRLAIHWTLSNTSYSHVCFWQQRDTFFGWWTEMENPTTVRIASTVRVCLFHPQNVRKSKRLHRI